MLINFALICCKIQFLQETTRNPTKWLSLIFIYTAPHTFSYALLHVNTDTFSHTCTYWQLILAKIPPRWKILISLLFRTYSIRIVNRSRANQARKWAWIIVAATSLRFSWARSSRAAFFCCRKLPFDDEPSAQNILKPLIVFHPRRVQTTPGRLRTTASLSLTVSNKTSLRHSRQLMSLYRSPPPPAHIPTPSWITDVAYISAGSWEILTLYKYSSLFSISWKIK